MLAKIEHHTLSLTRMHVTTEIEAAARGTVQLQRHVCDIYWAQQLVCAAIEGRPTGDPGRDNTSTHTKNKMDDPYETLPETTSVTTHLLAGAVAGTMEHCVMYPVDCVKTRMQCLVPAPEAKYRNLVDALVKIVRHEGVRNTVRGMNVVVVGAGPAHAGYFATYEKLSKVVQERSPMLPSTAVAAMGATFVHDAIMNPVEVVKQRMQVYSSPYRSCLHCAGSVLTREGPMAFYRSFPTQLSMSVPFHYTQFLTYETLQSHLNPGGQYNLHTHILAGACAGAVASTVTMPLDVCKTLINTGGCCGRRSLASTITGLSSACHAVLQLRGVRGFYRGLQARVVFQAPSTAIVWTVYETFKYIISKSPSSTLPEAAPTTSALCEAADQKKRSGWDLYAS